ncbi:unnamed protein product [Peronospora belbahrii]|uniref:Uncharacterized protein n=1 Tax=Peronospora belbahrii TaxID=622444 RepID=A0ABN8CXD0_9STRA|nr:unnamed protein product [Peronospora belbahrii]
MSRNGGRTKEAAPTVVIDGQDLNNDHPLAVPAASLDKMLAMLYNLSERLGTMESFGAYPNQEKVTG